MANGQHGGYRQPANPAPVSGPGAHSRRTDGGPGHPMQVASAVPDQPYGDAGQQMADQRIAPMGGTSPTPPAASSPQGGPQSTGMGTSAPRPGFGDPTARPDEPITAGVDIGPGPGSEAMPFSPMTPGQGSGQLTNLLMRLSGTDTTGILGQLLQAAQARNA